MKKTIQAVLFVCALPVFAWAALSVYFLLAGRDSQGDCFCEYSPDIDSFDRIRALKPEENMLTHLKWLNDNMPTNTTLLSTDHRLRTAYLNGTTNRLEFTDAARDYLAAESNTLACAARLLDCKVLDVPQQGDLPISPLMRIANISAVKAVSEASQGDVVQGRQTLMDVFKIGLMAMDNESYSVRRSQQVGSCAALLALDRAAEPLFVNGDDAWRESLRARCRRLIAHDAEYARRAATRAMDEGWRLLGTSCAMNREEVLGFICRVGRSPFDQLLKQTLGLDVGTRRLKWDALERKFTALLLAAVPGYIGYAFQPNRRLDEHRRVCARFCRKVDEPYDIDYARALDFGRTTLYDDEFNPFHRNWLGEKVMGTSCYGASYLMMFRRRFEVSARIAALACRSYKAKYGAFPEALDALVPEFLPEVPRDPYDGTPLRYNAEQLYLWTPGERLSFDGKVVCSRNDGQPIFSARIRRHVFFLARP